MKKYRYIGQLELELPGYGIVKPGDFITVGINDEINHPLFEQIVEKLEKTEEPKKNKK